MWNCISDYKRWLQRKYFGWRFELFSHYLREHWCNTHVYKVKRNSRTRSLWCDFSLKKISRKRCKKYILRHSIVCENKYICPSYKGGMFVCKNLYCTREHLWRFRFTPHKSYWYSSYNVPKTTRRFAKTPFVGQVVCHVGDFCEES